MSTIWKDIPGFEGIYQASEDGKIKSLSRYVKHPKGGIKKIRERIMAGGNGTHGYIIVGIAINNKTTTKTIHRLVAKAFLPNPSNLPEVNHKDGNKKNNNVNNLEWVSVSDNRFHAFRTGLQKGACNMKGKTGKLCPNSKPVIQIFKNGESILFDSIKIANEKTGICRWDIIKCAKGVTEFGNGYKWKYA